MNATTRHTTTLDTSVKGRTSRIRQVQVAPAATISTLAYALAAVMTVLAFCSGYLKQREADQNSADVDGEIRYYKMALAIGGFAAGCWAFIILVHFVG